LYQELYRLASLPVCLPPSRLLSAHTAGLPDLNGMVRRLIFRGKREIVK
jgi:hypothetical protein